MANLKAKNIYRIIEHVNNVWYSYFEVGVWKNYLITYGNLLLNQKLNVLNGLLC